MTHDAKDVVRMLRDHLAAHDRPISFLFGAGTSCSINIATDGFKPLIPGVIGLTHECKSAVEALGAKHLQAWESVSEECVQASLSPNIESMLSRMRAKLDALGPADRLCGLTKPEWETVDSTIRSCIARIVNPNDTTIPDEPPHHAFARWARNTTRRAAVEVFTTNYDVLFERSFDLLRIPHFDGFVGSYRPYFSPETVEDDRLLPSASWVRYWKIHGSVTWDVEELASGRRITRGQPNSRGELILPSHRKYDESRKQPYRALMDRLARVLARQDSLLIGCGFSFGDQHINAVVFNAIEQYPRTHVFVLRYEDLSETDELVQWAVRYPNLLIIGPNAGVISGRYGTWSVAGKPDVHLAEMTGNLIQIDPAAADGFRLRAGDFSTFCGFLAHMDRGRGRIAI